GSRRNRINGRDLPGDGRRCRVGQGYPHFDRWYAAPLYGQRYRGWECGGRESLLTWTRLSSEDSGGFCWSVRRSRSWFYHWRGGGGDGGAEQKRRKHLLGLRRARREDDHRRGGGWNKK